MISSVNLAALAGKLADFGLIDAEIKKAVSIGVRLADFTAGHAAATVKIRRETTSLGLLLGDRACLESAMFAKAPALTADSALRKVKVAGVTVNFMDCEKSKYYWGTV